MKPDISNLRILLLLYVLMIIFVGAKLVYNGFCVHRRLIRADRGEEIILHVLFYPDGDEIKIYINVLLEIHHICFL